MSSLSTGQLCAWIDEWRGGNGPAFEKLLRAVGSRFTQLAHRMLAGFPSVARSADTDVLQNATVRLVHSLRQLQPRSRREFFVLAALHVRRELLDLARYFGRRERAGTVPHSGDQSEFATVGDSTDLERWASFHEAVELLPESEREVVDLILYQGCSHAEAAEFLKISEKSVQRRWRRMLFLLSEHCAGST